MRPHSAWCANRAQHLTFGEFSRSSPPSPARRRSWPTRWSSPPTPATRPIPIGPPTSTSMPGRTTRPPPASRFRSCGRPAQRTTNWCWSMPPRAPAAFRSTSSQADVYYFAPQKVFGSDGGLWIALASPAALGRIAEIAHPTGGSRSSCRSRPRWTTPPRIRPSTLRRWPRCSCWPTRSTGSCGNGGLDWATKRTADSSSRLYDWAESASSPRRSCASRAALPGGRHHRLRRRGGCRRGGKDVARQRDRRHRAVPQAGPEPAADRHVPGGRAPDVSGSDACIDYVVERLG